jgi:hypothetical protein
MLASTIQIPLSHNKYAIHWGSDSKFERFAGSYFLDTVSNMKHVIKEVKYEPDVVYSRVDGMFGCCWTVTITEPFKQKYSVRNWIDIVEYYESRGFSFVEKN